MAWKLFLLKPLNRTLMKKSFRKFINDSLKKVKQHKEVIKKFHFSSHKEDFVITEQEEREGGYFGSLNFKVASSLK
jgi:hypothetical protein